MQNIMTVKRETDLRNYNVVFSVLWMEIILSSQRNYNVKQIIMSVRGNMIQEIIMWKMDTTDIDYIVKS